MAEVLWLDVGPQRGREVAFAVYGDPAPQGSKAGFLAALFVSPRSRARCPKCGVPLSGRITMTESSIHVKPWRKAVADAAAAAVLGTGPLDGPLAASMVFTFARPAAHRGTGRNAGQLRPSAPDCHDGYPDLSKLARSTEDALVTAGLIADDARIWKYDLLAKIYTGARSGSEPAALAARMLHRPGAWITVRETPKGD